MKITLPDALVCGEKPTKREEKREGMAWANILSRESWDADKRGDNAVPVISSPYWLLRGQTVKADPRYQTETTFKLGGGKSYSFTIEPLPISFSGGSTARAKSRMRLFGGEFTKG
jgi:hypothetical protein